MLCRTCKKEVDVSEDVCDKCGSKTFLSGDIKAGESNWVCSKCGESNFHTICHSDNRYMGVTKMVCKNKECDGIISLIEYRSMEEMFLWE